MKAHLEKIILGLKDRNALPKHIEMASVAPYFFANIYDELNSQIISESVACGFDKTPELAVFKGLSEFFEGKAFIEGQKVGLPCCQTKRSDGFAAFPLILDDNYKSNARKSALFEATERYVWSSWWDNTRIGFKINELSEQFTKSQKTFTDELQKMTPVEKIISISPQFNGTGQEQLVILIAYLKNGGVVSGGACGQDPVLTLDRALSELFRHALAVQRIRESNLQPASFYEKRLHYFATDEGQKAVEIRLSENGTERVNITATEFDQEVPHSFSDLFYVHRVLFKNQPEFIGGKLERFCI